MSEKPWDRPWSMEEIIENSDKWSLAGDVALLNTLKSLGDSILSRTTEINNNLHNLTKQLDETSLQLNIAQNEFQSLRNTQFIESRVYEDDETLPQPDNNEMPEGKAEPDRVEDIRLAALRGLEVLDQYYDKVEVSVSDSEDEDIDLPNYILRPKDLYIDRPLPYPIGSEEWHKSWHVGLEDSPSDSETEKVSDKFSESDSESDLPIIQDRSQIKGTSDTSSEFDFAQKIDTSKINISSKQELFHSSDSEDQNSMPVQAPISNKIFAEELAAKLGNVIKQEYEEPEVNRRPIQKKPQYGDLFFDEPPPLDEPKGLFSGGSGLFDDDDDDVQYSTPVESKLEESPKPSKETEPVLFDEENSDDDIFNTKKPVLQNNKSSLFAGESPLLDEKKKPVGGVSIFGGSNLFDKQFLKRQLSSDEESEDKKEIDEHDNAINKKDHLFSDDDNALFRPLSKEEKSVTVNNENNISKKINLFDSDEEVSSLKNNLFNERQKTLKQTLKNEQNNSADVLFKDSEKLTEHENESKEVKTISLFDDDDDDLFKEDLFSSTTKSKFTSGLFDDVNFQKDDLFSNKNNNKPQSITNLFDDDLIDTAGDKKSLDINTQTEDKKKLLVNDLKENAANVDESNNKSDVLSNDLLFGNLENDHAVKSQPEAPKPKPRLSLFDSPPIETDDLFSDETGEEKTVAKEPITTISSDIFDPSVNENVAGKKENDTVDKAKTATLKTPSLFDSPFDDDQDDLFGEAKKIPEHSKNNSNLFTSSMTESSENSFTEEKTTVVPDLRIFDSVPPPDDDWETKSENLPSDENDSFTEQDDITALKSTSSLFSEEPPSLDFLPKKSGIGKVSNITDKFEKEPKEGVKPNLNSPGKLKHNLNINVSALMPGSLPPKRGDLPKVPSFEKSEDGQTSFDTTDNVKVLHSITKDRVKVPLNRRPSTRRGRKAALKSSSSDFKLDQDYDKPQDVTEETISSNSDKTTEPPKTEDFSFEIESPKSVIQETLITEPATSDDLFEVESVKPILNSPKTLFVEPTRSGDLFEVKEPSKQAKTDLFEDDDDDDMFSSKKVPATQPANILKKSLFDDDTDDDDDIFKMSSNETRTKNTQIKSTVEKKVAKVSTIKKLENTKLDDVDDDPLSALLK